jgi:hypothetical protein
MDEMVNPSYHTRTPMEAEAKTASVVNPLRRIRRHLIIRRSTYIAINKFATYILTFRE